MVQFWLRKKTKKLNQNQINTQTSKKKKNSCIKIYIKKKALMRTWNHRHKKYKANKSTRTHVTKEHNNRDTNNTLIKKKGCVSHIVTLPFTLKNYLTTKEELCVRALAKDKVETFLHPNHIHYASLLLDVFS